MSMGLRGIEDMHEVLQYRQNAVVVRSTASLLFAEPFRIENSLLTGADDTVLPSGHTLHVYACVKLVERSASNIQRII